jgi:hypothetical protein
MSMMPRQLLPVVLVAVLSSALTLILAQVIAPASGGAAPVTQGVTPVVRAQQIEVVDEHGTVRVVLGVRAGEESAGISFRDADGRERAGMGTGRPSWGTGAGAYVLDGNGRLRAAWGLAPEDAAVGFLIFDETAARRVGLGGSGPTGYGIAVADGTGQLRAGVGPLPGDEGYGFSVRDQASDRRVVLGGDVDGATLTLLDAAGQPVWQVP